MSDIWNDSETLAILNNWMLDLPQAEGTSMAPPDFAAQAEESSMSSQDIAALLSFNSQDDLTAATESIASEKESSKETINEQSGSDAITEGSINDMQLFNEKGDSDLASENDIYGLQFFDKQEASNTATENDFDLSFLDNFVSEQSGSVLANENDSNGLHSFDKQGTSDATTENGTDCSDLDKLLSEQDDLELPDENAVEKEATSENGVEALTKFYTNIIKDLEADFKKALAEKDAQVNAAKAEAYEALKQVHQISLQAKKFADGMNQMQMKMQQMKAAVNSLNFADTPDTSKFANVPKFPDFNKAAGFTYPTPTFSPNQVMEPFTPQNPAQKYCCDMGFGNVSSSSPVTPTPVPTKKRKASAERFVGQFYQCRQYYDYKAPGERGKVAKDGRTIFCGAINNQYMAGGKSDGEQRQRCINKECKKYTDIKDKHWVGDWVLEKFGGVGAKAPMECPKLGAVGVVGVVGV